MIFAIKTNSDLLQRNLDGALAEMEGAASGKPSDHLLARYANGELLGEEKTAIDAWRKESPANEWHLQQIQGELEQARAAMPDFGSILARGRELREAEQPATEPVPMGIVERLKGWVMPHGADFGWSPLAGLAALAVMVVMVSAPPFGAPDGETLTTRTKSTVSLTAFTIVAGETAAVGPSTLLEEGDRLGLTFTAEDATHILLLSVDGRGTVSRFLPEQDLAPVAIERSWAGTVPFSLQLDDAPGPEVFVAFFPNQEQPLTADQAEAWLQAEWQTNGTGLLDALQASEGPAPMAIASVQKHSP